jgi:hypothetical protein
MFELHKAEKNGHSSAETKAETLAFNRGYVKDPTPLNELAAKCVAAEDADPEFAKRKADALAFMSGHVPSSR